MLNPTKGEVRSDKAGDGHHNARRGSRRHDGVDFICVPGQEVVSPISGVIVKHSQPYADDPTYKGLEIKNTSMSIKLFYVSPSVPAGVSVKIGQVIGYAQNVAAKHGGGMTPHVHLRITNIDPLLVINDNGDWHDSHV